MARLVALLLLGVAALAASLELRQADFAQGSVLLKDDHMVYTLAEDITFNPNSRAAGGTNMPRADQLVSGGGIYDDRAFQLGFFAAIVITGHNVTLDLNGKTLKQHPEHALQQRFFALIELSSSPFLKDQGPHDFAVGPLAVPVVVSVINGQLGLSSHHGIHGNGAQAVLLRDLVIRDFEVAGVHLNGAINVRLENVIMGPTRRDVPVTGLFSTGMFLRPYLEYLVRNGTCAVDGVRIDGRTWKAAEIQTALLAQLEQTYQAVVNGVGRIPDLWDQPSGHPDGGSVYGLVLNQAGQAVFGLAAARPSVVENNRILSLNNVTIQDITSDTPEVIGLITSDGTAMAQIDAVGATLQYLQALDANGNWRGNVVSNAQMLVHKFRSCFPQDRLSTKRSNIATWTMAWAASGSTYSLDATSRKCSGDTMFHVSKGVFGARVDAATDLVMNATTIRRITNRGRPASPLCGLYGKSHPKATQLGYNGATALGLSLSASATVNLTGLTVQDVMAFSGSAYGVRAVQFCSAVVGEGLVSNVTTLYGTPFGFGRFSYSDLPMSTPDAVPMLVDDTCQLDMTFSVVEPSTPTTISTRASTSTTRSTTTTRTSGSSSPAPTEGGSTLQHATLSNIIWIAVALVLLVVSAMLIIVIRKFRKARMAAARSAKPRGVVNPLFDEGASPAAAAPAPRGPPAGPRAPAMSAAAADDEDAAEIQAYLASTARAADSSDA